MDGGGGGGGGRCNLRSTTNQTGIVSSAFETLQSIHNFMDK